MKVKHIFLGAAVVATIMAAVAVSQFTKTFSGSEPVRLYIPTGSESEQICDSLCSTLGEADGKAVFRFWQWSNDNVPTSYGSYVVEPGDNLLKVARRIAKGNQTPLNVALNNMRTLDDLAKRLSAKLEFTPDAYLAEIDSLVGGEAGFTSRAQLPAAFIPDTYNFFWNERPKRVISRLLAERNKFWSAERRAKAAKLGLTPVQVVTVASIVEEESAKSDEFPTIARLYLNRVHKGMKLQADPTVKFAVGDFSLRRITGKHLQFDSPYNTYKYEGLPPGPIRIAQRATIDAVLDAPQHTYIYMCAKEDFSGRHNFASDYATHQANAKRYQAELNRRGIH